MTTLDVLIIGAGQAGLALGYHLQKTGLTFQLVERQAHVGESWRQRYDSLILFTTRRYSALPGLALAGAPDGYPGKDEVADYLAAYARHFNLPVKTGTRIQLLERHPSGYRAVTETGAFIEARRVVIATGAFQTPVVPPMASQLSPDVLQLTVESYKNAGQVPPGVVLIVGDGAAGRDIAHDLQGRPSVMLATGRKRRLLPERLLGKSTWWWLDKLGLVRLSGGTALGRRMQQIDPFPGKGNTLKHLQAQGVRVLPKVVAAQDHCVTFADGATAEISAVIWAIGYRDNSAWAAVPQVKDAHGNFVHWQGITALPDFYFIGRPWQLSRGSALITGVGDDAERIKDQIMLEEKKLMTHETTKNVGISGWRADPGLTPVIIPALMALAISFTVSLVATTIRVGPGPKWLPAWLLAFAIAAVVAIPTAIIIRPQAQRLVRAAHRPQYAPVMVSAIMAVVMSFTMSLVMTTVLVGLAPAWLTAWLTTLTLGAAVAIPTAIVISPLTQKLANRLAGASASTVAPQRV